MQGVKAAFIKVGQAPLPDGSYVRYTGPKSGLSSNLSILGTVAEENALAMTIAHVTSRASHALEEGDTSSDDEDDESE